MHDVHLSHRDDANPEPETQMTDANADRYLKIVAWARKRYTRDKRLVTHIMGVPAACSRIEEAAWRRYSERA